VSGTTHNLVYNYEDVDQLHDVGILGKLYCMSQTDVKYNHIVIYNVKRIIFLRYISFDGEIRTLPKTLGYETDC